MKKLLIVICMIGFAISVHSQTQTFWCLNGYTRDNAKLMVQAFNQNNTGVQKATSVWFDMPTIDKIKTLLVSEKNRPNPPDGVRIYFGYDLTRNQNTVILVSTYAIAGGHTDYFDHVQTSVPANNGDISNANDGSDGAQLYVQCQTLGPPPPCPCLCMDDASYQPGSNQITRKYAQEMVSNFNTNQKINSHAEWFPLDAIKRLDDNNYTGVRIYFGRRTMAEIDTRYQNEDAFVIENTKLVTINGVGVEQDSFNSGHTASQAPALRNALALRKVPALKKARNVKKPKTLITQALIAKVRAKIPVEQNAKITDAQIRAMFDTNGVDEGELCPDHCDPSSPLYTPDPPQ